VENSSPFTIVIQGIKISAGVPNWYNSTGKIGIVDSSDVSAEGKYLEFVSPKQIYDKNTNTYYYDTDSVAQFAKSSTWQQYISDSVAFYWPSNALTPVNGVCQGGIITESSSASKYLKFYLEPAEVVPTKGSSTCWFDPSNPNDTYNLLESNSGSEAGYGLPPSDSIPLGETLTGAGSFDTSTQMAYAMFQWVKNSTNPSNLELANMNDTGVTPTPSLEQISSTNFSSLYSAITGANLNVDYSTTKFFTTQACIDGPAQHTPFLAVTNYSGSSNLTNLDITINTKAYFYFPNDGGNSAEDSQWNQGWDYATGNPSAPPDLSCLFDSTGEMPANNPINSLNPNDSKSDYSYSTSNGYGYTFVAYPNNSVCVSTCTTNPSQPGSGNSGSSGVTDACFDSETGYTYECGGNPDPPSNVVSKDPVVRLQCTQTSSTTCPTNNPYIADNQIYATYTTSTGQNVSFQGYEFVKNQCYAAEFIPSDPNDSKLSNVYAWVEQDSTKCSTQDFQLSTAQSNNPPLPLPRLGIGSSDTSPNPNNCGVSGTNCIVSGYLDPFIKFLSISVSLVVVIAVVTGGIQYSTSQDNPEAVKAARKRIFNALLALVCYFLLYAFLNFIIPNGI
jgi:hypothetical protein